MLKILLLILSINILFAKDVYIYSKNSFTINGSSPISMEGYKYIVIDIEDGLGSFYAYNRDGSLEIRGEITAGSPKYRTPSGIFNIIQKKKHHMSTIYPSDSGKNNMNDMLKITNDGIALHKGSLDYYSHGCIHIEPSKSRRLFNWATSNTRVVITRDYFSEFVSSY